MSAVLQIERGRERELTVDCGAAAESSSSWVVELIIMG
jgi:hypothetical protein